MSAHGDTRRAAYAAACALAAAGERPTVAAIRARLDGRGGQQALLAGLNDWIAEAARRFQLPALPDRLQTAVADLWESACQVADDRWHDARGVLEGRLIVLEQTAAGLTDERNALAAEGAALRDQVTAVQAELFAQVQATRAAEMEAADLQRQATETAAALAAQTASAAALEAQRQAQAATLAEREAECADLRARAEGLGERAAAAERQVARLDAALAAGAERAARLQAELAAARSDGDRALVALAERDAQVQRLTELLERLQITYDKESAHWLMQIDEQRQALSAARERAARDERERSLLLQQVQSLSQALQARAETSSVQSSPP